MQKFRCRLIPRIGAASYTPIEDVAADGVSIAENAAHCGLPAVCVANEGATRCGLLAKCVADKDAARCGLLAECVADEIAAVDGVSIADCAARCGLSARAAVGVVKGDL